MRQPYLLLLLLLSSCSFNSQIYTPNPLASEILTPRPGHDGKLTNRTCSAYSGETCVTEKIVDYDLSDPTFRSTANTLNFICKIGGKRYKVCKDQPGFCRMTYHQNCTLGIFCGPNRETVEFLPIMPYQTILNLGVKCFSQSKYDFAEE